MTVSPKQILYAAAVAIGLFANLTSLGGSPALAAGAGTTLDESQGMVALKTFWSAIVTGTPQALGPVLAPEYQIQRNDGSGFDKEGYLKSELPKIATMPKFTSVKVTGTGDLLVVRYFVTVNSTRGGKAVQKHAPRLTIFRKEGSNWLVVAHANFATLGK